MTARASAALLIATVPLLFVVLAAYIVVFTPDAHGLAVPFGMFAIFALIFAVILLDVAEWLR